MMMKLIELEADSSRFELLANQLVGNIRTYENENRHLDGNDRRDIGRMFYFTFRNAGFTNIEHPREFAAYVIDRAY